MGNQCLGKNNKKKPQAITTFNIKDLGVQSKTTATQNETHIIMSKKQQKYKKQEIEESQQQIPSMLPPQSRNQRKRKRKL